MRNICFSSFFIVVFFSSTFSQFRPEIGVELNAAGFSNLGGSIGGAVRGGLAEYTYDEATAYGVILRYQRIWTNNSFTGQSGSGDMFGLGAYWHYRFMEWFFIGAELELVRNTLILSQTIGQSQGRWQLAGFLCAGASKDFDWVRVNLGLQYDVVDAIRDETKQGPFRNEYFLRLTNPTQPGAGGRYLPLIYRLTFFFPIGGR